jgi:hypothetical protein
MPAVHEGETVRLRSPQTPSLRATTAKNTAETAVLRTTSEKPGLAS